MSDKNLVSLIYERKNFNVPGDKPLHEATIMMLDSCEKSERTIDTNLFNIISDEKILSKFFRHLLSFYIDGKGDIKYI